MAGTVVQHNLILLLPDFTDCMHLSHVNNIYYSDIYLAKNIAVIVSRDSQSCPIGTILIIHTCPIGTILIIHAPKTTTKETAKRIIKEMLKIIAKETPKVVTKDTLQIMTEETINE